MEIGLPVARHIQTPRGRSWGDPLCDAGNLPASGFGKAPRQSGRLPHRDRGGTDPRPHVPIPRKRNEGAGLKDIVDMYDTAVVSASLRLYPFIYLTNE